QFGDHFKFINWQSASAASADAAASLPELIARLDDESRTPLPPISVRWFSRMPSQPEQPLELTRMTVYKKNDPTIATDANGLGSDISQALDALVPTSTFMEDAQAQFVSRVPVAQRLTPIAAKRIVELPMTDDDLPVGLESVMNVDFRRSQPQGA